MSNIRGKFSELQKINEKSYKTTMIYLRPRDCFIYVTDIFGQFMVTNFTPESTALFFKFHLEGHQKKNRTENPNLIGTVSLYIEGGVQFVLNMRQCCV
jgi:hypothetical protein